MADERPYQMILGGMVLIKDGVCAAVASPSVVYANLAYKHVQGMWQYAANNPAIVAAQEEYAKVVHAEMIKFGNAAGLAAGWMSQQDLKDMASLGAALAEEAKKAE